MNAILRIVEMCIRDREGDVRRGTCLFDFSVLGSRTVSYTHLDVYKRQVRERERGGREFWYMGVEGNEEKNGLLEIL